MCVCFLHQVSLHSPALHCSLPSQDTPLHVSDLRTKISASSLTSSRVCRYFGASYKALFLSCDLVSIISLFTLSLISEVRRERECLVHPVVLFRMFCKTAVRWSKTATSIGSFSKRYTSEGEKQARCVHLDSSSEDTVIKVKLITSSLPLSFDLDQSTEE